jgi:diguanylate cyclase (GGDEF)-like protein/PAS domain S-box-containing protein
MTPGVIATPLTRTDLRAIFETAPVGHVVLGADHRIVEANAAFARIAGCAASWLVGRHFDGHVDPLDAPLLRIALAELGHDVSATIETEVRLRRRIGDTSVTVAIHAAVVELAQPADRGLLLQVIDVTERKRLEAQLQHLADHDPLTGLLNRRRFEQELARHVAAVRRYGAEGAVMVLDVDRFKRVNDTYGHSTGDRLIADVASVLGARLRSSDVLGRLGGDEFAILLPKADRAGAEALAHSLVETVRSDVRLDGIVERCVTISVGVVALADAPELSADAIVAAADRAMYAAKSAGRDGWSCVVDALAV